MALALDQFYLDGDIYDVLEDCDALRQGLARLRRQGRVSEQDWRCSTEHLAAIRARIEAQLTAR